MANQYSDKTRRYLLGVYKKFGVDIAIRAGYSMLCSSDFKYDKEFQTGLHGEICETILEIMLRDFIKKNNIRDWYVSKSLVLVNKDMTTELDITLFTPKCIYIFECKCYYGDKVLLDTCTIQREGQKDFDVYSQNLFHKDMILKVFKDLRYVKEEGYNQDIQLVYFDFSGGSMKDKRTGNSKSIIPLTGFHNLYSIFNNYKELPIQWDIEGVVQVVKVFEENHDKLMEKHLKRLKAKYK